MWQRHFGDVKYYEPGGSSIDPRDAEIASLRAELASLRADERDAEIARLHAELASLRAEVELLRSNQAPSPTAADAASV